MYVYIYIYMYMYIHIYSHIMCEYHSKKYRFVYMYIYMYIYIYMYMHIHVYNHIMCEYHYTITQCNYTYTNTTTTLKRKRCMMGKNRNLLHYYTTQLHKCQHDYSTTTHTNGNTTTTLAERPWSKIISSAFYLIVVVCLTRTLPRASAC